MHPEISRGIAAERMRDMQARAARGRLARQARVTRRAFHRTRPTARPAGDLATLSAQVPAQRDRATAEAAERPAGSQERRDRAA